MRLPKILLSLLLVGIGLADSQARTAESTIPMESVFIMQVDGWIIIDPQGKVADYQRKTLVPANLVGPIERAVRTWLFKPVVIDGAPVQAKAEMRITLAAQKDGEVYKVRIDNVTFPENEAAKKSMPDDHSFAARVVSLKPASFPERTAGFSGMVLLGLKIGLDGRVENCAVIQSSLVGKNYGPASLPAVIQAFESSAIDATKAWRFAVDMEHGVPTAERLTATIVVGYVMEDMRESLKPGKWHFEARTARSGIPWLPADSDMQRVGVSDSSSGGLAPVASSIRLISNPNGTAL